MSEMQIDKAVEALNRVSMVLGALYASHLGNLEQKLKAERLSRCGFGNAEIANILGTTVNTINVGLHHVRKSKSSPRKKGPKARK